MFMISHSIKTGVGGATSDPESSGMVNWLAGVSDWLVIVAWGHDFMCIMWVPLTTSQDKTKKKRKEKTKKKKAKKKKRMKKNVSMA